MAAISPELRSIFCEALELPREEERRAYLDRACQGDPDLRARIDALLLAHHDLSEFLEQPVPPPSVTWDAPGPSRLRAQSSAHINSWSRSARGALGWFSSPSSSSRCAARWP